MRSLLISASILPFILLNLAILPTQSQNAPLAWWQQSVIYQIYPRSFQDSDGDGVGDINGITSRLDYFMDLGIDAIWISPMYESPMKDFGYDISNFTNIDPIFGSMADFERMSQEFKARGIKLIMDLVPNHSSDLHEWFQKSLQKIEPYTDYYVWKNASGFDTEGNPLPPNNWVSVFGGSSWEWREERGQFYLHQFVKEQPDLNYENIKVRNAMLAIVKFWLDMGVDGFRVDAVTWMYEDQQFLDEPEDPNRPPEAKPDEHRYWSHIYTFNLNETLVWLADMRQLIDVYSAEDGVQRAMMVEAWVVDESVGGYYGTPEKPVAHFPFNFHMITVTNQSSASEVLNLINVWNDIIPEGAWPTIMLGNHDQKRVPKRWTLGGIDGANMINLLLRGTPITYYGEEIGMEDRFLSWEETVDPAACNTDPDRYEFFSRDPARTPFQWSNETSAGFSTNPVTWLPVHDKYLSVNVEAELEAEESHLKVYQELIQLRQTNVWRFGGYESHTLNNDQVLAFTRTATPEVDPNGLLVVVNLSDVQLSIDIPSAFPTVPSLGQVVTRSVGFQDQSISIGGDIDTGSIPLGPRESIVIRFDVE